MSSRYKVLFLVAMTILAMFVNPSVGSRAAELDLTDSAENSWISVDITTNYSGEINFNWISSDLTARVQISGDLESDLYGQHQGSISQSISSDKPKLEYRVIADRELPSKGKDESDSGPKYEVFIANLIIDNPGYVESIFGASPALASGAAAKTYLRYQTFIPKDYVEAPGGVCTPDASKSYVFKGDNRGFDPASSAFRTRFQVTVDWTSAGDASIIRTVGSTHRYLINSSGIPGSSPESTDTASASGMVFTNYSNSSTLVHFKMDHAVTNPMCNDFFTFPIWYSADVWIARSGAYTINMQLRRAPNHELYIKDSDQLNWKPLLQESTYSMDCFNKFWVTQFACSGPSSSPSGDTR